MKETQVEGLGARGSDSVATLDVCRFISEADEVRKQEQLVCDRASINIRASFCVPRDTQDTHLFIYGPSFLLA